ncbi:unnamed protein product [Closterium sp. NIES-64]|nr:unnamed protein product [Closterium sp. NIES-64]CAI6007066.1 unnamed protein product [Closterium sp. NIES-64]
MVKPCSNKSNKKGNGNALDKEEINVPDVPVKDLAGTMKSPAGSASAAVLGPFEDLLDLQKNINKDAEEDGKEADENGADAAAPQGLAGEHEAREELGTDDNEQDEVDASPSETPGEEDDGYLSDDSDEHLEPDSLNCVIAFKRFSLTLLVPISRKTEVTRAAVTVAAPLDDWKEHMSPDVLQTTTYQELTPTFFSGTRYGRLQVTFNHVRDAKFVWNQVIRHKCVNGDLIDITWQHPEDARFLRERVLNPTAKEVVIKGVPAEITAELIRRLLVVSKLVKRGRSTFASGFGFHRTVDPVTGLDTDRIRGLFIPHADDKYRWRYFVEDPTTGKRYLLHFPLLTYLLKRIIRDLAVILTSTGTAREEWVCVQTACEKAQGNSFEQASAHIASARHKGGLRKDGSATRVSKFSQKLPAFKKEFITKQSK